MSDCCPSSCSTGNTHQKHRCPGNEKIYSQVSKNTIFHHIKESWNWISKNQAYYFCDDPMCNIVYFGDDNSVIEKSELRIEVGIKEKTTDSLLCYCFGITFKNYKNHPEIKSFVLQKTKEKICACETRNPSGKCCLKDF